jgi:hypothetical protein
MIFKRRSPRNHHDDGIAPAGIHFRFDREGFNAVDIRRRLQEKTVAGQGGGWDAGQHGGKFMLENTAKGNPVFAARRARRRLKSFPQSKS